MYALLFELFGMGLDRTVKATSLVFQCCLVFVYNSSNIFSPEILLLSADSTSPSLCIQNFLTCLELERRYALENRSVLVKCEANWGVFMRKIFSDTFYLFKVQREQDKK